MMGGDFCKAPHSFPPPRKSPGAQEGWRAINTVWYQPQPADKMFSSAVRRSVAQ